MFSEKRASTLHGVLLIVLFSCSAFYIAEIPFVQQLSFSPLIVGIILGMLYANSLRNQLPETWVPGIKLCTKQILRTGIVLYGFRLTFQQVMEIGLPAVVIDAIVIFITLALGMIVGRILKMDEKTALMTSTGSAICGAAAVLGAEPVVKCAPYKTAIAVSTVVIFGTISMFLYPIMYRTGIVDLDPQSMAIYTGSTLHEVAHVVGAGNAMDATGALHLADQATITKMIRVMMLAPVLLIMSYIIARVRHHRHTDVSKDGKSKITIPWFAILFIVVAIFNSFHLLPQSVVDMLVTLDTFLLAMAMAALGLTTHVSALKKAGAKPLLMALVLFAWLIVGGAAINYVIQSVIA